MNTIILGLILGFGAGIIDIIPMLMQKLSWNANLSAFIHWVFLGVVIANVSVGLPGWLTGLIFAVIGAIPIILVTSVSDPRSALPILAMSALLGSILGFVSRLSLPH